MVIFGTFFLLGLNYFFLKIIGLNLIFFFMRFQSLYFYGFKKKDIWTSATYLLFFPEMITGPHREFASWSSPRFKIGKIFNIDTFLELLFCLNVILGSGYIYKLIIDLNSSYIYQSVVVVYTLFFQFWASSRIVNVISTIFDQKVVRNFNNPFLAISFSDFWARWHISLGNFAKKYITQPLNFLTLKKGYSKYTSYLISIFISFLFIGLWHKISLAFLFFALISSTILLIERLYLDSYIKRFSKNKKYQFIFNIYSQLTFILAVSPCINNLKNILIKP